jgi:hypothetical protein
VDFAVSEGFFREAVRASGVANSVEFVAALSSGWSKIATARIVGPQNV